MGKQEQFFQVVTYDDGTRIAKKVWAGEQQARSWVAPSDKRFPPPTKERKALAESYVHAVMGKGILGLSGMHRRYRVWAMGNDSERCRECGTSNNWRLTHCRKCGEYIPRMMYMHSSVECVDGVWKVNLGRDVTQTKKLNPMFSRLIVAPGIERDSEAWICFVHAMHLISPVAYAMTHHLKSEKFAVAQFREFSPKDHFAFTEALVNHHRRLVNHMQD